MLGVYIMKRIISLKVNDNEILDICRGISKMDIECAIESKKIYSEDESLNVLRIKLYGHDKYKIMNDYKSVMNLVNKIHKKYSPNKEGLFEYHADDLKYPLNKKLIIDVLDNLNVKYKYLEDGNIIKCSIAFDEFNELLKELYSINSKLNFVNLGSKTIRNAIVLISYFTKKDVDDIIDECIDKEFFRVENGRIMLNKDINLVKRYYLNE